MGTSSKNTKSKYTKQVIKLKQPLPCPLCKSLRNRRMSGVGICPKCFDKYIRSQRKLQMAKEKK